MVRGRYTFSEKSLVNKGKDISVGCVVSHYFLKKTLSMSGMPNVDASDDVWKDWARRTMPIAYQTNASLQNFIFKKRFPLFTNDNNMETALCKWKFCHKEKVDNDVGTTCVCTNRICNLFVMRCRNQRHATIGSECFKRYFSKEHHKKATQRMRSISKAQKLTEKLHQTPFHRRNFQWLYETSDDVTRWTREKSPKGNGRYGQFFRYIQARDLLSELNSADS